MKALFFNQFGIDNLLYGDYELDKLRDDEVLIETKCLGVNPIDYFTVTGFHGINGPKMNVKPIPHIPGSEIAGIVKKKGDRVKNEIKEGDRVIVYNRIFDGTCKLCRKGFQMLCNNGKLVGVMSNGGFSENFKVSEQNIIKIPDSISWELAASIPVSALTAFNAIKESDLRPGEVLVIFGGSGNTGIFCSQIGKIYGAKVISISSKQWIKDFGVDEIIIPSNKDMVDKINEYTNGHMADVVINSLGEKTWIKGMQITSKRGKIISFGVLTGGTLPIDGRILYNNQITIKGTTGGSLADMSDLLDITLDFNLKTKIWKKFSLEESKKALELVFDNNRDGRILITNL